MDVYFQQTLREEGKMQCGELLLDISSAFFPDLSTYFDYCRLAIYYVNYFVNTV